MKIDDTEEKWVDPIVREIHVIREAKAKEFNYDPEALFNDLLRKQEEREKNGHTFVTLPPKRTGTK